MQENIQTVDTANSLENDEEQLRGYIADTLSQQGIPEYTIVDLIGKILKKNPSDKRKDEYAELKRDEFYEDIENYRQELDAIVEKFEPLNLTVKNAYDMLRGQKRAKELLEKHMILSSLRKTNADERRQPSQTSQQGISEVKNLDATDSKVLKKLQETFPDGNWTAEYYLKVMERNNIRF